MTTIRFDALIGLALGAVWVFAGFLSAVLVAVLTAAGAIVGAVATGRVDVSQYLGPQRE